AGLLLAPGIRAETVDFTRPRKAPDVASRRRQLVLAGVGTAAVIVVGAMTGARFHLADLQREVDTLSSQRSAQLPGYMRYWRDRYKIDHLEQWEAAGADWLEHFAYVMESSIARARSSSPRRRSRSFSKGRLRIGPRRTPSGKPSSKRRPTR
ncbi:MAG: hypothetical protein ACYTF4_11145, partial [Planctomycetota bacterium]